MKPKYIFFIILCLSITSNLEAQFLKKLKKKAEQAVGHGLFKKNQKETEDFINPPILELKSGNTLTGKTSYPDGTAFENPSLNNNTEAKRAWYNTDVRVTSFDKEKQSDMVIYFDADAVAMQSYYTDQQSGNPQTSYIDSDGFFISYNKSKGQYNKSSLLSMAGMSMMAPAMMASAYKLPESTIYNIMEEMKDKGLAIYPFMHVDFAFVLKPEHFREDIVANKYRETKQSCRGKKGCVKFSVLETGYDGSYTLFDNTGRLVEINIAIENDPFYGSGKGKIAYFYEDVNIRLPAATEKKIPGQDLFKFGLDPNKN